MRVVVHARLDRSGTHTFEVNKRLVLTCASLIHDNEMSEPESQALVAAIKSEDTKKVEKLLIGCRLGANNPTFLAFVRRKVAALMNYVMKCGTPDKATQETVPAYTDTRYMEVLEELVTEAPALGPSAADSTKELYNSLKNKIEQTLKVLMPLVQSLQEENSVRNLEINYDAEVKEAKAKSTRQLLDELNKFTSLDDEW